MRIAIIEDEQLTANDLVKTIRKINPYINIVALLYSVEDAVAWFKHNEHPDLIFSDIQLGDGLCFDIFKSMEITSPIVFCTAYDEYALTAFKTNGIDYILKPFDQESVNSALMKYNKLEKQFSAKRNQLEDLFELFENRETRKKGSLLVYYKDKILPVKIIDIALFFIVDEMTHLITFNQEKYTINMPLDELENIVGHLFFRANRQYLLQRKAVKEASQYFARSLSVTLTIPLKETIKINKVKVPAFLNWLSAN